MKHSCEIIKDLLPLYHDDVCSNESRSIVEEHLLECDSCKKYLEHIKEDLIESDIVESTELKKSNALKRIKKKLLRKNIIVSLISIVCAAIVALGALHYQMPISYEEGLLSVTMAEDGVIDVLFNGENYYCSYGWTRTIEKDGVEETVAYIYYTDTLWTKYISDPLKEEPYQFSIGNSVMVDYGKLGGAIESKENISAVYYLIGDYSDLARMAEEEFEKAAQDAVLLWEK